MKNLYAFLFLASCSLGYSQILTLESTFKNKLVNTNCVDFNNDSILDGDADTNNDGEIQISEALSVTGMDVSYSGLTNIVGINAFLNLKSLLCNNNGITALSISGLASLETLDCSLYQLTQLNLTGLTSLKTLICIGTQVHSLDVSNLPTLENLQCSNHTSSVDYLNTLNITGLTNLKTLDCSSNNLTALNVSNFTNLISLKCNSNLITGTGLTLGNLPNLLVLECDYNDIAALNLSGCSSLTAISCKGNLLTSLNLSSQNNLKKLNCGNNDLSSLTLSNLILLEELDVSQNNISTLDISNLTNLIRLECWYNNLTQLNVSNQPNLKYLKCRTNHITSLNVLNLIHLEELDCSLNELVALDVSNLAALRRLDATHNHLTSLTFVGAVNLENLYCEVNNLTSLDVANYTNLVNLSCGSNALATLDFTNMHKLLYFSGRNNPFTSLDFSVIDADIPLVEDYYYGMQYDFYNCTNLVYLNIKTGVKYRPSFFGEPILFNAQSCTSLAYVCVNDGTESYSFYQIPGVQVNSYCFFNPGGQYNTIAGTLTYDLNNNGCDAADTFSVNNKIRINSAGATFTDVTGNYNFFIGAGSYTIAPDFENPYFTVSPPSALLSFADINDHTETQNFCVTPNGIHNDVEISILPIQRARPGFDATYQLVYKNKGNQVLSGNVNFVFDDAVLDFVSSNPALTNQTPNNLNWNYSDLLPFESRTINFTLNVNSPLEMPAVNIGDILNFNVSINPIAGDETMADNTFPLAQTVVGSFDPNDKICLDGNNIAPEMVGGYLHYLIRFQNSGTAAAENVVIKDIIDTTKFDMASLQLTSSSHPQVTKITGNKVEFQFQNINLPAELDDAAGSNGYVAFKIKTKNDLVIGNSVSNKADIFFDYNFPIETNTATSTVALLGVNTFENTSVNVTPNPTKNTVNITSKGNITSVQLFDVQGRVLETMTANDEAIDFDLSQKNSGVYFVKIYTVKGIKVEKLIKE